MWGNYGNPKKTFDPMFDVYYKPGPSGSCPCPNTTVKMGAAGEAGMTLIPSYLLAFKTKAGALQVPNLFDFKTASFSTGEGNRSGWSKRASIKLRRRGDLSKTVKVTVTLQDGPGAKGGSSAKPGITHRNTPIVLSFKPNQREATVSVPIQGNKVADGNKVVYLKVVSEPAAGVYAGSSIPQATLTIRDDDKPSGRRHLAA